MVDGIEQRAGSLGVAVPVGSALRIIQELEIPYINYYNETRQTRGATSISREGHTHSITCSNSTDYYKA